MDVSQYLINNIKLLSGPLIQPTTTTPYSTYHFDNLKIIDAQRNTLDRLKLFGINENEEFKNYTLLDLGSNLGAMSLEFARRKAIVTGIEFNSDRVNLCNKISSYLNLNADYIQSDLNSNLDFLKNKYDIVLALAIDKYIENKKNFYSKICDLTQNICYFESNDFSLNLNEFSNFFTGKGFCVNYIGNPKSELDKSLGPARKLFIISKNFKYLGGIIEKIDNIYVKNYASQTEWDTIKKAYNDLKFIKQIPIMDFSQNKKIITNDLKGEILANATVNENHKYQFLTFLKQMNRVGYAHRDLNCSNIIVFENKLFVIDWDFVVKQECNILSSYDLTGNGLQSPRKTNNCHIFRKLEIRKMPSVAEKLNITKNDFIDKFYL